jgi:hypothetical protein
MNPVKSNEGLTLRRGVEPLAGEKKGRTVKGKFLISIGGGVALLGCLFILSATALNAQKGFSDVKEKNPPRIKVIPETYDFGKVPPKRVSHTFLVKNIGGSNLEIYRVSTSCGCTTASIDSNMIEPGETAKIVVNFDPTVHRSSQKKEIAQTKRTIYIRSNDPEAPEKTISITATIVEGE